MNFAVCAKRGVPRVADLGIMGASKHHRLLHAIAALLRKRLSGWPTRLRITGSMSLCGTDSLI